MAESRGAVPMGWNWCSLPLGAVQGGALPWAAGKRTRPSLSLLCYRGEKLLSWAMGEPLSKFPREGRASRGRCTAVLAPLQLSSPAVAEAASCSRRDPGQEARRQDPSFLLLHCTDTVIQASVSLSGDFCGITRCNQVFSRPH